MFRLKPRRALVAGFCALIAGVVAWLLFGKSAEYRRYERVTVGMSVGDVESILGPGAVIAPEDVPQIVVTIQPDEGSTPWDRHEPTRTKPVVEGEVVYRWRSGHVAIYVAFSDGKVREKSFHDYNL